MFNMANILSYLIIWIAFTMIIVQKVDSATKFYVNSKATAENEHPIIEEYYRNRRNLIDCEVKSSFGSDLILSRADMLANKVILEAKEDELTAGLLDPYSFNPSRHIFEVLDAIKQSKLFEIIQKMPKGGILHAHESAMCSADCIVSLTYWPNLWQKSKTKSNEITGFRFARVQPNNSSPNESDDLVWRPVKEAREAMGAKSYDDKIRKMITLFDKNFDPKTQFKNSDEVWKRFEEIFAVVGSILAYPPVRKAYFKNALKEMLADGVQYLEFRGGFSKVFYQNYILILIIINRTDCSFNDSIYIILPICVK